MHRLGELRTIKDAELELMLSWRNALAVRKNMYTQHKISFNEHLSWWDRIRTRVDQKYFMYEIDGKPCGIVAFNKIDLHNKNSSWAFYASPHAAKGTGSRMEFLALECAFSELSLHKLNCEVLAFNIPVIKLHQKFGFKVEGIIRQQYIIEQNYSDVYQLGILAEEWKELRKNMLDKLVKLSERKL